MANIQSFVRLHPSSTRPAPLVTQYADRYLGATFEEEPTLNPTDQARYIMRLNGKSMTRVVRNPTLLGQMDTSTAYLEQTEAKVYKIASGFISDPETQANWAEIANTNLEEYNSRLSRQGIDYEQWKIALFGAEVNMGQGIIGNPNVPVATTPGINWNDPTQRAALYAAFGSFVRQILGVTLDKAYPTIAYIDYKLYNYLMTTVLPLSDGQAAGGGSMTLLDMIQKYFASTLSKKIKFIPTPELNDYPAVGQSTVVFIAPRAEGGDIHLGQTEYNFAGQIFGLPGVAATALATDKSGIYENSLMRTAEGVKEHFLMKRSTAGMVYVPSNCLIAQIPYNVALPTA